MKEPNEKCNCVACYTGKGGCYRFTGRGPVFGVILMTAITAVIASLVFLLVSELSEERNLESMPKVSEDGTSATNETSEDQSERDNDTVSNGGSRDIDSVPIGQIRVWGCRLPSNGSGPDGAIGIASCDDPMPYAGEEAYPLEEFTPAPEAGVLACSGKRAQMELSGPRDSVGVQTI